MEQHVSFKKHAAPFFILRKVRVIMDEKPRLKRGLKSRHVTMIAIGGSHWYWPILRFWFSHS